MGVCKIVQRISECADKVFRVRNAHPAHPLATSLVIRLEILKTLCLL